MAHRFQPPLVGAPTPVRFPAIAREQLRCGLRVCALPWAAVPVVTAALLIDRGAAVDPPTRPGLASLTADLVDEGAGGRDAVQIAEAFERLGSHLEIDVGQDIAFLTFTTLARHLDAALALLADVVIRPHLAESDLTRVRDLRLSRLQQLRSSASAAADRAFLAGVFGGHPYGHGSLGTTASLEAISVEDVREFHGQMFGPVGATLIVAGDVGAGSAFAAARARFEEWIGERARAVTPLETPQAAAPRLLLVDRPGAPQSELRIGQIGPPRLSSDYHALVTLNAALGGQFTSRINQHLREVKGYTYGARTGFEFRRACSSFAADTSVQSDATANAVADILAEFEAVRSTRPLDAEELDRARNSLTRGYVRHFETPQDLVRATVELTRFSLPDDTFDRFVAAVNDVTADDVREAARQWVRPEECVAVVVGDAEKCRAGLVPLGREIVQITPEF
jgi:zinc protease